MPPIEGKPAGKREEPMGEGVRGGGSPEGRKAAFDGKKYLERTLQKLPGEMMKVVQIPQTNSYRVNWYDPAKAGSGSVPGLSVMYIRKSEFLFCRLGEDGEPVVSYPARQ